MTGGGGGGLGKQGADLASGRERRLLGGGGEAQLQPAAQGGLRGEEFGGKEKGGAGRKVMGCAGLLGGLDGRSRKGLAYRTCLT